MGPGWAPVGHNISGIFSAIVAWSYLNLYVMTRRVVASPGRNFVLKIINSHIGLIKSTPTKVDRIEQK